MEYILTIIISFSVLVAPGDDKTVVIETTTTTYKQCLQAMSTIQADINLPGVKFTIESKCDLAGHNL
jgi:hypothetical protein